jgi:hypothetical protein
MPHSGCSCPSAQAPANQVHKVFAHTIRTVACVYPTQTPLRTQGSIDCLSSIVALLAPDTTDKLYLCAASTV